MVNELGEKDLYRVPEEHSELEDLISEKDRKVSKLFTMVAYTDASFAVGLKKQSISGWIVDRDDKRRADGMGVAEANSSRG